MSAEADEGPVTKLVYAILLSALRKRATDLAVRRVDGRPRVDFVIDGTEIEEMRPPLLLHQPLVRRLAVMASLPTYAKGEYAEGTITLRLADDREASFAIRVEGHGDTLAAYLHVLSGSARPGGAA
jgi:type II secretory ATPase GspE/PulE/Tfp pilus assembly ATPase PilB-like protein